MKITDEKIDQLAHLARLEFSGEAKEAIKSDLEKMLGFCEKLKELDTEGYEPLIYLTDTVDNLREDVISGEVSHADALKNAPKKDSDFFRVPKVIGQ
ncbi:MAG: Asp-tRNA(Asn)/Glu-tRNA(Gln) amidotransferase subunit GatC [Bacteroidia bacterium]|nr:Asp-tRNA(Asn)/Glu-tRNA(Gln) amidotransferase subunit GatC [Bacteroidia bacterium]